jgi:hypothetical protein
LGFGRRTANRKQNDHFRHGAEVASPGDRPGSRTAGTVIDVERHGQVVARIIPAASRLAAIRPWEALHGTGTLLAAPEESVLEENDFKASR